MEFDLLRVVAKSAASGCAVYAIAYFYLMLLKPAYFLRNWDIDRPIRDPKSMWPRRRFKAIRYTQLAVVFVGLMILGYAAADTIAWALPNTPSIYDEEDGVGPRSSSRVFLAFILSAGLLSLGAKYAFRLAFFDAHVRLLKDVRTRMVWWAQRSSVESQRTIAQEARSQLTKAQEMVQQAGTEQERFTYEEVADFWKEVVSKLQPTDDVEV